MSQIVSVADIYEAITGARSYQEPTLPEHACLVLARLAGDKAQHGAGQGVRQRDHVLPDRIAGPHEPRRDRRRRAHHRGEPLHPVIALMDAERERLPGDIDTSQRSDRAAERRRRRNPASDGRPEGI